MNQSVEMGENNMKTKNEEKQPCAPYRPDAYHIAHCEKCAYQQRAVNSHEEMLAALKEILASSKFETEHLGVSVVDEEKLANIIAKAEGE